MKREQLTYQDTDPWIWIKAGPEDVEDILDLVEANYELEIDGIFTSNRTRMAFHLHEAILKQTFNASSTLVTIARLKDSGRLIAWAWCERGKFTVYANEEMAVAEFAHVDLSLSLRQRTRICAQTLEQWIAWTAACEIPVLCSTSIRDDQSAFMRIHDVYGFRRRGSFAYLRIDYL